MRGHDNLLQSSLPLMGSIHIWCPPRMPGRTPCSPSTDETMNYVLQCSPPPSLPPLPTQSHPHTCHLGFKQGPPGLQWLLRNVIVQKPFCGDNKRCRQELTGAIVPYPDPSSKEERRVWRIEYSLTQWAGFC